ncbi:ferritin family protein [bacterium]|nr:ferritin family protein [bacterium]
MSAEVISALKFAIEAEKIGLRAYLDFARSTNDATGKNMFITIACDEVDHWELLEEQLRKIESGEKLHVIEVPDSRLPKFEPSVWEKDKRLAGDKGVGQITALKTALKHERDGREIYLKGAESVDNPEVKKMFLKLADMEQIHFDILQAELDSITGTGYWFDLPEFNLEMG